MLSKELISFVKNLNGITNSLVLQYPRTAGVSEYGTIAFVFNTDKFESEHFEPIYLNNNLSEFLSIFGLFDKYTASVNGNVLTLKDDNTTSSFILSEPSLMGKQFTVDPEKVDSFGKIPTVAEFDMTVEMFKKLKSARSVFKTLGSLCFEGSDGINLYLTQVNHFSQTRNNTYTIHIDSNVEKHFKFNIGIDGIFEIPCTEYKVQVKYNSSSNIYCLFFECKSIPGFYIVMSTLA